MLIGICGIGLGIYAIFFQPQQPSAISNIWAVEQDGSYSPSGTYSDMPNMNVLITVNAGETEYGTFSALFTLSVADTWFNGGVWVLKDSVGMISSQRLFSVQVTTVSTTWVSLTTQFLITNLDAGIYELNVQLKASSGAGSTSVSSGLLYVYTYR